MTARERHHLGVALGAHLVRRLHMHKVAQLVHRLEERLRRNVGVEPHKVEATFLALAHDHAVVVDV